MKKKGTTIIEIIVVISIIFILLSCFLGIKSIDKIKNDIAVESVKTDISNMLTLGKQYANSNKVKSRIIVGKVNGNIALWEENTNSESKKISETSLPNGFSYDRTQYIDISEKGVIEATTINFTDRLNEIHKITIAVGTDIITIY